MTNFTIESWTWYGVVICMVALRFTARLMLFKSILRLQIEDWLMLFITCLYTILIAFLNIDATVKTNLINPADVPHLTPHEIKVRTWGSKTVLLVEQCMCAVQWGTKSCLLLLYWRLTQNLTQNLVVKAAAVYVGVTYVVMEILYFGVWCRPFHDYWQTPTKNTECTTALHHLIVNLAFNLSSDILIMSIPLPLLLRAHLEWKRKVLLVFPFTLGLFTITCAILSKHLSFTQPFSAEWVYWYCRESSTAMIVTNTPYVWTLVRRVFNLKSFFSDSDNSQQGGLPGPGFVVNLQGLSVREASEVSTSAKIKSKASTLLPERWKGNKDSTDRSGEGSVLSQGIPGRQSWLDAPLSVHDKTIATRDAGNVNVPSSMSSNSSMGKSARSVRGGGQSNTADAVDKLYRLDDLDDEIEEEVETTDKDEDMHGGDTTA